MPAIVHFDEGHRRSEQWFGHILRLLNKADLKMTLYLQKDGSIIYKANEIHGGNSIFHLRVYPDGTITGGNSHD